MSWVAAAFGSSQLKRLPYYDEIRARNAALLGEAATTRRYQRGEIRVRRMKHPHQLRRPAAEARLPDPHCGADGAPGRPWEAP